METNRSGSSDDFFKHSENINISWCCLQGISRFQAVAVGTHIYIHTHRTEDHILRLDTSSSPPLLERLPVQGPAPSSRGLHSMVHVGDHLYVLFGAPQKGPMLDDVWRLDLNSLAWEELTGVPLNAQRHQHDSSYISRYTCQKGAGSCLECRLKCPVN